MKTNIYILILAIFFFSCGNPCQNGGVYDNGSCVCPQGWEGKDCSTPSSPIPISENPNPATDNSILSSQNDISGQEIRKLRNIDGFNGLELFGITTGTSSSSLVKFLSDGGIAWQRNLGFRGFDICDDELTNNAILVGGFDSDNSMPTGYELEEGRIAMYNNSGDLVKSVTINEPGYKVHLRAVKRDSDRAIYAVGLAIDNNGIQYPYLVRFKIYPFGDIHFTKVFTNMPKKRFQTLDVKQITAEITQLVVTTNTYSSDPAIADFISVHDIGVNNNGEITQGYNTSITTSLGLKTSIRILGSCKQDDFLYIAGTTEVDRQQAPSDGGHWDGCLVAKIDINNGVIIWKKILELSDKSDEFHSIAINNDKLYIVGEHSRVYYNEEPKRAFSNGLLALIDINTGNLLKNYTFGDKTKFSKLQTIEFNSGYVYLGGLTKSMTNNPANGWLLKVVQ